MKSGKASSTQNSKLEQTGIVNTLSKPEEKEPEGFICPYCLVGFATSSKLQSHFVEMHSGQGVLDEVDHSNGEEEVSIEHMNNCITVLFNYRYNLSSSNIINKIILMACILYTLWFERV